jgi:thiosulfate dehydrogenase
MRSKRLLSLLAATTGAAVLTVVGLGLGPGGQQALAHKEPHIPEELKAFEDVFTEQVILGDLLFHGDTEAQQELGVSLSDTGMACAMCHPDGSDVHPHEFPKYQQQMQEFATLRDMINWCIEKPNQGTKIDSDSPAMKALEAYIYWSNSGSMLDPGRH